MFEGTFSDVEALINILLLFFLSFLFSVLLPELDTYSVCGFHKR